MDEFLQVENTDLESTDNFVALPLSLENIKAHEDLEESKKQNEDQKEELKTLDNDISSRNDSDKYSNQELDLDDAFVTESFNDTNTVQSEH